MGTWCHSCWCVGFLWSREGDALGHRGGRLSECTVLARSSFGTETTCRPFVTVRVAQFGTAGNDPGAHGARIPPDLLVARKSRSSELQATRPFSEVASHAWSVWNLSDASLRRHRGERVRKWLAQVPSVLQEACYPRDSGRALLGALHPRTGLGKVLRVSSRREGASAAETKKRLGARSLGTPVRCSSRWGCV